MNVNTSDEKVREALIREIQERMREGEHVEIDLNFTASLVVLTALQIEIRCGRFKGVALTLARDVAATIEKRLSTSPGLAEYCERGWSRPLKRIAHVPTI
jgi:hypothetical protein